MSAADEPANGWRYRITTLEEQVRRLLAYEPAVQKQRIDQHDKDLADIEKRFDDLIDELKGVRRALYSLALALAGVGLAAVVTALQITG